MLKRLDNIGVAVRNARTSLAFYIETLGFEGTVSDGEGSAKLGDMSLYIFESKSSAPGNTRTDDYYANPRGIDHMAFEVADIEAAGQEFESRGVTFLGGIVGDAGQFRYRGFHDPDGNMLYIIQQPAAG